MQRGPRHRVPQIPGPVREDQGPRHGLPVLRPSEPSGPLRLPAQAGLGQPRRPHRPAPGRVRGERRPARVQPVWGPGRQDLLEGGQGRAGQSPRDSLREEEAETTFCWFYE
ncbi:unnamed protein product [Linum tenue]|uniref:Uncharacterized protein n=1 Tax=Linum tenue TaxID=586396 RepID=A0AAV0ISV1_9ROSI|nr:unnamed protein product [Linum tenue]